MLRQLLPPRLEPLLRVTIGGCIAKDPVPVEYKDLDLWSSPCSSHPPDWKTGTVWVKVTLETNRPAAELAKLLDPQSWDVPPLTEPPVTCNEFFVETCIIGTDEMCLACPPPPGTDWSGTLAERVRLSWDLLGSGLGSEFYTDLAIVADQQTNGWEMRFCLGESHYAKVGNNVSGKIYVDEGLTRVAPSSTAGWWTVEAHKLIRFEGWKGELGGDLDPSMELWARALLPEMGGALKERVCCTTPTDPACPPGAPTLLP
jgi:hypothetical protein